MPTERDKMLAGQPYDPLDAELVSERARARDLWQALNATREADADGRRRLLVSLFGRGGDTVWMQPPFFCDYGSNIELGERVFFNFNCVVLDVCSVRVGSFTLFGPAVQISRQGMRICGSTGRVPDRLKMRQSKTLRQGRSSVQVAY